MKAASRSHRTKSFNTLALRLAAGLLLTDSVVECCVGWEMEFYNFRPTMGPPRSILRKEPEPAECPSAETDEKAVQLPAVLFRALRPFPAALAAVRDAFRELL